MKRAFKWTAVAMLFGAAGMAACGSSEASGRASELQKEPPADAFVSDAPGPASDGGGDACHAALDSGADAPGPALDSGADAPGPALDSGVDAPACGGPLEDCCRDNAGAAFCRNDLECRHDTQWNIYYCQVPECGEEGQTCCPWGTDCYGGTTCQSDGRCHQPCGAPGQACCPDNRCNNEPLYRCSGNYCTCTGTPGCPVQ